jgi:hypothetical protein
VLGTASVSSALTAALLCLTRREALVVGDEAQTPAARPRQKERNRCTPVFVASIDGLGGSAGRDFIEPLLVGEWRKLLQTVALFKDALLVWQLFNASDGGADSAIALLQMVDFALIGICGRPAATCSG